MNNPMSYGPSGLVEMVLAMSEMGGAFMGEPPPKYKTVKEEKLCLLCGKPHKHNNAFCSAECCKKHKEKA